MAHTVGARSALSIPQNVPLPTVVLLAKEGIKDSMVSAGI